MTRIIERPFDASAAQTLIEQGMLAPLARALAARGIHHIDEMTLDWKGLIPPSQLEGTDLAAARLLEAREKGEPVTIVADYDCDGATACTIAIRGLTTMGLHVSYVVPDRVTQGYGLTPELVDIVKERFSPQLIVTVDNGITSVAAVEHAKALGIDVIVTDHHLPGEEEPAACCIVNPNRKGCSFPSKNLAGVGVMFYVLLALRALMREKGYFTAQTQPRLDQWVDLVALGTVADVVKLDKNNRILVAQGLKRVRAGKALPGLSALFTVARKKNEAASVRDFGFAIGPRINAAGRLSSMESGIECLLADQETVALSFAQELNLFNSERQELETEMQQCAEEVIASCNMSERYTLSLFNEHFNEGVVGLVASRVKDRIHRPVFAFAPSESGFLKGSGRSIPGIHLRDTLDLVARDLGGAIIRFGGHAAAAGLTLKAGAFNDFQHAFEQIVRENCSRELFERVVYTDGPLVPSDITEALITDIDERIWGQAFEAPLFSNEFRVVRQTVLKEAHLKLVLDLEGKLFEGIFFRRNTPLPAVARLAYRPNVNEYMGRRQLQLQIEAVEESTHI